MGPTQKTMIGYVCEYAVEPTVVEIGYDSKKEEKYKGKVVGAYAIMDNAGNLLVTYNLLKEVHERNEVETSIATSVESLGYKMTYSEFTL